MKEFYMVIGGSGFLGRHIVQQLVDRGDNVCIFDIVQRYFDVPFYPGDITNIDDMTNALQKSGTTCIIHTASPSPLDHTPSQCYKVNVDGTKTVIDAAVAMGVRKLVFTSSASVVFSGGFVINADERLPYTEDPFSAYSDSKTKAEQAVLKANGTGGLLTVALRPAGIFGPGDRITVPAYCKVYTEKKTHFQIGDNNNLFDWTYVGNVAKAHLLAADKLDLPPPGVILSEMEKTPFIPEDLPPFTEAEERLIHTPLPHVNAVSDRHRVPTSQARLLGPFVELPHNAKEIENAFKDPNATPPNRPIYRNRYDQFTDASIIKAKLRDPDTSPLQVAGQAFFITNGESTYFWDLARLFWHRLDEYFPGYRKPRSIFQMSRLPALVAATLAGWFGMISNKVPTFTRVQVAHICAERWYNIEKARRVLGYHPDVSLEEGVKLTVEWLDEEYKKGNNINLPVSL